MKKRLIKIGAWTAGIVAVVCLVLMLICNQIVVNNAEGKVFSDIDSIKYNKVGLLLGTTPQARITKITNYFFIYRIDAAEQLYKAGKIEKILISGDEDSLDGINEPECMRDSLVARGVPASAIILDGKGYRTINSIVNANKVFGLKSFIIISQEFHNERAIYQAEHLGLDIDNIQAYNAQMPETRRALITSIREYFARVKMFLDLFTYKEPVSYTENRVVSIDCSNDSVNLSNNIKSFELVDSAGLISLVNTLVRHVDNNGNKRSVNIVKEEKWMMNFRKKLCAYYDCLKLDGNIPDYAKVDTVLNIAERCCENSSDMTTVGMINNNISCSAINVCREYRLLSEFLNCCANDKQKKLIYQECEQYVKMYIVMEALITEITFLNYWGGSIVGPLCTYHHRELSSARIAMYKTMIQMAKREYSNSSNESLNNAEYVLLKQLHNSILDLLKESGDWQKELKMIDKESFLHFKTTIKETKEYQSRFKPLVENWTSQWRMLENSFDSNKKLHMEAAASQLLLDWSKVVSSIKDEM
jgi:SanA protein